MKLFVWDFHGVLEKGNVNAVVEITNKVLENNGYRERITLEQVNFYYGKPWYEYFQGVLPNENLNRCKQLRNAAIKYQREHPEIVSKEISANDHAAEVLRAISSKHDQIVISSVAKKELKMFIDSAGLGEFFPEGKYFAAYNFIFGFRKKTDILNKYLKKSKERYEKIVLIGDSAKDLMPVPDSVRYLYAQVGKQFRVADADYKINDLREVLREI